ncbi:MAG: ATP-binding cassette domain-containing protein [Chlamydiae bacterium]|nr:ATP-binding cassette domain-containing protein [Chlamydiota bacterium]
MIVFDKITKSFGEKILFDNACVSINKFEKCALVGSNGSGKTTLFRLITNNEVLDSGNISIPKNYSFGYLDQHIKFSQETILKEALQALPIDERDNEYKAEKILFGLGFSKEDMQASPHKFSGGYQLRLHLCKVLLKEPSCLLLDEPTNYLDIVSINWFIRFLKAWRGECIIISHDRGFLDSVSTHTLGVHRNKIFKVAGGTANLFNLILQEEELYEKTRINLEKKKAHLETFITRFSAKASKASQAQSKKKALEKLPDLEKLLDLRSLHFAFNEAPVFRRQMLKAQNLNFSYNPLDPSKTLIENLSINVEKNDRIAIIGKNGYGKSTILKLLSLELNPISGTVEIAENSKMGYFGQTNINRLNPDVTIEEEISLVNPKLNKGQVLSICGLMMFSKDDNQKKISVLSGGEKSRVLLGKIIARPCNLLLLDEPTNHLDMESIEALLDALESFEGAIIIVTHSELILRGLELNKLIICNKGEQTIFLGSYDDFLEKMGWPDEEVRGQEEKKQINPKELKKIRAEIIQAKSNELGSLKKEILAIENTIDSLEKQLKEDNQKLIEALEKKDGGKIALISKAISQNHLKIEDLFEKFSKLSQEYEDRKKYYDEKLE